MKKLLVLLVLMLAPALAQSVQVSVGSPFGINAGVKFALIPVLADARVYVGANFLTGGATAFGGGADALIKIPLTDLYAGGGLFYATGPSLALLNNGGTAGGLGARGVIGTYLNVGIPLLPIGIFIEGYPMYFFGSSSFGIGGAIGVNIGF